MRQRQIMFPEAAKYCEGILYLVPGKYVHEFYSSCAPSAYVELGHAPTLFRAKTGVAPEYEFGFYGSLSERRLKILKKLSTRMLNTPKAVRIVADFSTQEQRDEEMQRCKVILQIRKFDKMGLVSSSRCNTALHLGRPVVAEPHDLALSKPWNEVVQFTNSLEEFYATANTFRALWRWKWEEQYNKLRTMLTPDYCVGRAFREIGYDGQNFRGRQRVAA